jgi:WhiB family redox-sensing transcriptional regulator
MSDPWGQRTYGAGVFEVPRPPDWMKSANCTSTDPDIFHAESKGSQTLRDARKVCGNCDVVSQCLEWALEVGDRHGILGGLTPGARQRLARERRKAAGGMVRCRVCDTMFKGLPQNSYCSKECHLVFRRRRDRRSA